MEISVWRNIRLNRTRAVERRGSRAQDRRASGAGAATLALAILLRAIVAALAAGIATQSFAYEIASLIERLPRGYVGSFQWDEGVGTQQVAITFTALQLLDDGNVEARGCGRYDASGQVTEIRVKMHIDATTLAVEMWELDPIGSGSFTTDGSHKGKLSSDLQRLDAEWLTTSTGQKGRLLLTAGSSIITCAAPSARGPGAPNRA
ncbi:MAG: hypothetical protein ACLPKB_28790 [Xanthobacteraceae bacterium]